MHHTSESNIEQTFETNWKRFCWTLQTGHSHSTEWIVFFLNVLNFITKHAKLKSFDDFIDDSNPTLYNIWRPNGSQRFTCYFWFQATQRIYTILATFMTQTIIYFNLLFRVYLYRLNIESILRLYEKKV